MAGCHAITSRGNPTAGKHSDALRFPDFLCELVNQPSTFDTNYRCIRVSKDVCNTYKFLELTIYSVVKKYFRFEREESVNAFIGTPF